MTWVKLDDGFYRNRKARLAGKDGRALFIAGLCHCSSALTDGHIGNYDLPIIAAEAEVKPAVAATLVKVGLWDQVDDGWLVHDYSRYNRAASDIRKERDNNRTRAERSRVRSAHAPPDEHQTSANGAAAPSSSRPSGLHQSSSSNRVQGWAEDDDDDWSLRIAKRRGARRETEVGPVGNRKKWLLTTVDGVLNEYDLAAGTYWAEHPEATPLDVADHLEPGPETTSRRAEKERSCELCEGRGLVENEDGTVTKCDHNFVS